MKRSVLIGLSWLGSMLLLLALVALRDAGARRGQAALIERMHQSEGRAYELADVEAEERELLALELSLLRACRRELATAPRPWLFADPALDHELCNWRDGWLAEDLAECEAALAYVIDQDDWSCALLSALTAHLCGTDDDAVSGLVHSRWLILLVDAAVTDPAAMIGWEDSLNLLPPTPADRPLVYVLLTGPWRPSIADFRPLLVRDLPLSSTTDLRFYRHPARVSVLGNDTALVARIERRLAGLSARIGEAPLPPAGTGP